MTTRTFDLHGLVAHLEEVTLRVAALPVEAAIVSALVLAANVKAVMGTTLLADLAPATMIERVRLGYTPNDPLVRSGELRSSIEHVAVGPLAVAGSSDIRLRWLNDGTPTIVPRPHMLIGLNFACEELAPVIGKMAEKVLD